MASISDFGEGEPSERYGSFPFPRRSMELSVEVNKAQLAKTSRVAIRRIKKEKALAREVLD